MPPGLISLPLRSSPTRRALLQTAVHLSHGTLGQQPAPPHRSSHTAAAATPTTANTTAPDNMLGKAAKAYGANAPPPSSSASKPTANSDIRDRFKKPTPASAGTEQDDNLSSQYWQRSLSQQSQQQSQRGANHGALASLYSCGDSFREEQQPQPQPQKQQLPARQQNVVDLTGSSFNDPASKPKAKAQPEVFFVEDDFSDDNDLDLDFEAPSALPPMPKKAAEPAAKENVPPPQPSTQEVEWSSSPASHFQAPKREETQPAASLKRQSSGESDSVPQPPPAKKRTLPASFREPAPVQPSSAMTPAHNSKKDFLDPTASAIKEQRRLLKDKRQADTAVEIPETFAEDEQSHGAGVQVSAVNLSGEQRKVLDVVVKQGKSVFFTGPAGTGKSVLMRAIIKDLKEKFARDPERVAVTASTGLAACNIGGMTLHSFSGIGLGKEPANILVKKIRRNPKAKGRWLKTKVLIVDEVSMVDGELFDKLSEIGRIMRNNGRPWGGIQLVITGDFFQLPPVPDAGKTEVKFAFDASTWGTSIDYTFGLTQVFRQKDPQFARMLNEMRLGKISPQTEQAFKALARPLKFDDGVDVAQLFPTRAQVENSNNSRLRALPGEARSFAAADSGDQMVRDKLLQNMMAPPRLELKVGAQVMLIKNWDANLVNGSLGKVVAFSDENAFEMTTTSSSFNEPSNSALAKARAKLEQFKSAAGGGAQLYPVVQFIAIDGTSRTVLCQPEEWKVELPNGQIQAKRTQLPLILAWALSIHKAQGQTLERVSVDLGRVFEKGQAYVALSRATSQQGLQVLHFNKTKVMAHPKVVDFYEKLKSVDEVLGSTSTTQPRSMMDFVSNRKGVARR